MKELSFKTNARHIGQLGRELVTDFVTALVELIKNAYDADAECAKIVIKDTKSVNGQILIIDSGKGMSIDDFENKWMVIGTSNKLSEPYTEKGRKKAGKKGIGRFSVERLAERVTIYSFPKDETAFSVHIDWNRFEELDIAAIKQRIKILYKRKDREAAKYIASQMQFFMTLPLVEAEDVVCVRKELGGDFSDYQMFYDEDALLRLENSVMPILEKYEGRRQLIEDIKTPLVLLENIDDSEAYQELHSLCQKTKSNETTGLVMVLDGLRDEWTQKDIDKLQKELRLLVAPNFLEEDPFFIEFKAPEFRVEEMVSVNDIIKTSFAKVFAQITDGGQKSYICYEERTGEKREKNMIYEEPLLCGDISFELYYFLRDSEHMQNAGYNYRFATRVLDTYCGIKIYRDKFRVKPYGEFGNDWLYLDKEKVKDTHAYLVGNNQTIGRVNISDEKNPLLIDATNREGIIENVAFEQLREFVKDCISFITEIRREVYAAKEDEKKKLEEEQKKIEVKKTDLAKKQEEVSNLIGQIVNDSSAVEKVKNVEKERVYSILEKVQKLHHEQYEYQRKYEENAERRYKIVQDVLDYKEAELAMYKNLASLGMLAGEFGHETSDIVNRIPNAMQTVIRAIRNEPKYASSYEILQIVKDDFRRISSYSDMIIAFLRKRKREKCDNLVVKNVVREICDYYNDILREFNIDLQHTCDERIEISMRQVDLESIIINLLTNAYAQLKVCSERKILIRIWQENNTIRINVDDSGPGVPKDKREEIFKAFISSKEDGVGLGLSIVRDIVTSYGGTIECKESTLYGGACFAIKFIIGDDGNVVEGNLH